jgi:hypothetical protein
MTPEDVQWISELFEGRYGPRYNWPATQLWYLNIVLKAPMQFFPIRTDNALCITSIGLEPWHPQELEAFINTLVSRPNATWEVLELLRESVDWAKKRGCTRWRFQSDTGNDIAPLMKRLGAKEIDPRFAIEFKEVDHGKGKYR